jgi:parallel beta-helix repeat protein
MSEATTLKVPQDIATIQAAINAAQNGDTVLVAPGTYVESIDFLGKAITVTSEQGPGVTKIDANLADAVVKATSGETRASVLSGFTLTHGLPGAIQTGYQSSPTISGNVLADNRVCNGSAAIQIWNGGSPLIQNNVISTNTCDPGAGGSGIFVVSGASSSPQILDNVISNHRGTGISLLSGGTTTIRGNTITGNGGAPGVEGGGIQIGNFSDVDIINNVITGNSSLRGGGIHWLTPSGTRGPLLVNNTIAGNDSAEGSGIYADGFDAQTLLVNNIIVAKAGQTAVVCGNLNDINPPIFQFNDVYSPSGALYAGICTDQTGHNGNISADPLFVNPSVADYHLPASSPAINAGTNSAPSLPASDKDGLPRISGGIVDMGAFELPLPSAPVLVIAESRKVHGSAGTFNLPLALVTTSPTIEPRVGSTQTIVMTFDKSIASSGNPTVTEGTATFNTLGIAGNEVILNFTGVTNPQYLTFALANISATDGGTGGSGSVRIGFLPGDINQSGRVTVSDLGIVNAALLQKVTNANFLLDVNMDGRITVSDKGLTNANLLKKLPAP